MPNHSEKQLRQKSSFSLQVKQFDLTFDNPQSNSDSKYRRKTMANMKVIYEHAREIDNFSDNSLNDASESYCEDFSYNWMS